MLPRRLDDTAKPCERQRTADCRISQAMTIESEVFAIAPAAACRALNRLLSG
jgi:hypothetical protein